MGDPAVVVPVVLRADLLAVDLDGQRVQIDREIARAMRTASRPYASGGHLEQPAAENGPMLRAAQHAEATRERRLRRQSVGHDRGLRQRLVVVTPPPGLH